MNNRNIHFQQKRGLCRYYLTRLAARLAWIGLFILSAGICDVGIRLFQGLRQGAVGMMLTLGYDVECLVAGITILTGGVLLLDYLERREKMETS